jgi:hypothetical protein
MVRLAEIIELDAVQPARPRVAQLTPPVEDRLRAAIDVLVLVEFEARSVGWREPFLD